MGNYRHKKGCGCQSGILSYIPIPYADSFRAACAAHDDDYGRGGTSADRHTADLVLFYGMMKTTAMRAKELKGHSARPIHIWWMATVAYGYFLAVRIFGRFYFRYNNH